MLLNPPLKVEKNFKKEYLFNPYVLFFTASYISAR
jgi:hypothetical protein